MECKSTLTIEITPGTTVYEAFEEAIRIARMLNCKIKVIFNDVKCFADPEGSAKAGEESWKNTAGKNLKLAFATKILR
jgi:hypothetical protein